MDKKQKERDFIPSDIIAWKYYLTFCISRSH